jgi:hypothetical protein
MFEIKVKAVVIEPAADSTPAAAKAVNVQLLVINGSKRTVAAGGRWAVKDEDTQTVREAVFGRIVPGGHEERFVTLPSGVEWGIFNFKAEDGAGVWTAPHAGHNTEAYKLTLGD